MIQIQFTQEECDQFKYICEAATGLAIQDNQPLGKLRFSQILNALAMKIQTAENEAKAQIPTIVDAEIP